MVDIPVQTSPASSLWSQLLRPQGLRGQSRRACSPPPQPTSSIHTGPEPGPNLAPPGAASAPPQPSSRQATAASLRSHPSSHTVPQRPPCHTSRRPEHPWGPETRRSRSAGGVAGGWGGVGVSRVRQFGKSRLNTLGFPSGKLMPRGGSGLRSTCPREECQDPPRAGCPVQGGASWVPWSVGWGHPGAGACLNP